MERLLQNSRVEMPITTPGSRIGATISAYSVARTRPPTELIRMAAAVPMGTDTATTANATKMVFRNAIQMRLSFHRSINQRSVNPFHGQTVGSLLSLNAAPPITSSGISR